MSSDHAVSLEQRSAPTFTPMQRVAEGIMLLTRPSVSHSISQSVLFFLSAQLYWNRSTEFPELCSCEGHTMQMCISTGNFDSIFSLEVTPFLNSEIWPKRKILLKQFVSSTPLKLLNRILWNFVLSTEFCETL